MAVQCLKPGPHTMRAPRDPRAMLDTTEFDRWRATASDALESGRAEAARNAPHWACFLSEQACQFALKGLLHGVGQPAWGHDATELGQRVASALAGALPQELTDAIARLGRHYIATRYPDAHPAGTPATHYTAADAAQALADAEAVLSYADDAWTALREAAEHNGSDD